MSKFTIPLVVLILVLMLAACGNKTMNNAGQESVPIPENTNKSSSLNEQVQESTVYSEKEAGVIPRFELWEDFTVDVEDSRGDKFTQTSADLYYRYYFNVLRSGVLSETWEDANDIRPEFLANFFVSQTNWNQTVHEDIDMPSKFIEPYISRYFTVESEHLRESMYYDVSKDLYRLPLYPTGIITTLTNATVDGDILTLEYDMFEWDDEDNPSVELEGKLKIQIEAFPDFFRYISNEHILV